MSHLCDGRDLACPRCVALAGRLGTVRTVMTTDDALDDIKRARIWTRLEDRLADAAPRRPRWPVALGFAATAAAAIAAVAILAPSPRPAEPPHLLSVPADTTVSSRIGPHTWAALVGPAQLELIGTPGDATVVRLQRGTLLAEFAGGPNRTLRVEAPATVIDVVGTLFAVEVRGAETCTSVEHGRVRVTGTGGIVHVAAGERYCTGGALHPIANDLRDALERHQAALTASATPADPALTASATPADPALTASAPPADPALTARAALPAPIPAATNLEPPQSITDTRPPGPRVPSITDTRPGPPVPSITDTRLAGSRVPSITDTLPRNQARDANSSREPQAASSAPLGPPSGAARPITSSAVASDPPLPTARPAATVGASPDRTQIATAASATAPTGTAASMTGTQAPLTADELYRAAEAALAARDPAAADRALAMLLAEQPGSSLVDQALYERARIAYQQRAWTTARRHLDRLATIPGTLLAEPGHYLACRIAVEAHDRDAESCLAGYRRTYPRSPHDLEALALLAQFAHARAGCAAASGLIDELVRTYPRTSLAAAWRVRCTEPR
jgi:TolA-binding protein